MMKCWAFYFWVLCDFWLGHLRFVASETNRPSIFLEQILLGERN
jgi:hypothetical protein